MINLPSSSNFLLLNLVGCKSMKNEFNFVLVQILCYLWDSCNIQARADGREEVPHARGRVGSQEE